MSVPLDDARNLVVNNKRTNWRFTFNGILPESTSQDDAYERIASPVVTSVLEGFNGTIFACDYALKPCMRSCCSAYGQGH